MVSSLPEGNDATGFSHAYEGHSHRSFEIVFGDDRAWMKDGAMWGDFAFHTTWVRSTNFQPAHM